MYQRSITLTACTVATCGLIVGSAQATTYRANLAQMTRQRQDSSVVLKHVHHRGARLKLRRARRLHHLEARALFRDEGVRWVSSGGCSNRSRPNCTSFEGLRSTSVMGLLDLRANSRCPLTITGGTEVGHARGPRSHARGYKLDIAPNRCVSRYIRRHAKPAGTRGDGARLYRARNGTVFARESSHWDITFR